MREPQIVPPGQSSFDILADRGNLIIGGSQESAYLYDKRTKSFTYLEDMYGNPECAYISPDNSWCLAGGHQLILWQEGNITLFPAEIIQWIYAIREAGKEAADILTDPWSADSAIWRYDNNTGKLTRVRDFKDYYEQEYAEEIIW